jgi:uncharacterized protein (TIGR02118 family)
MTDLYTRRAVTHSVGASITLGMLASAFGAVLPKGARAAGSAAGGNCLTILYPAGQGVTFNADYYRDHHLVTIMKLYGKTIDRFELRTVAAAPAPRFSAAVNIWISDLEAFNANNQTHGATLRDDVHNFTNGQPTIQYDKVHGEMGEPRSAMKRGDTCLTIVYPNGKDVRWDVDYYRTHHMPLIMKLYGSAAIKRFELRKGDSGQQGGAPAYIGSVNIYINDQQAFDAAGKEHGPTLVKDVPHFSSVMPLAFPTTLYGVA